MNGVFPVEKQWFNLVDGYYSVNLEVPETCLFSNGKGTSYEYALASAYGEFMERLQNQIMFRTKTIFSNEIRNKHGFIYAPDEIYLSLNELKSGSAGAKKVYIPPQVEKHELAGLFELCMQLSDYSHNGNLISVPFFSKRDKKVVYVPLIFLDLNYASNGMCAGNTRAEAMVQGLCEILERHSKYHALVGDFFQK